MSTNDSNYVVSSFDRSLRGCTNLDFFERGRNWFRGIDFDRRHRSGSCVSWRSDGGPGRKEERADVVAKESTERLSEGQLEFWVYIQER